MTTTTDNPALRLYNAWDGIWQIAHGHKNLKNYAWMRVPFRAKDERPPRPENRHLFQLLNWKHGIQPTCLDEQDRPVYAFGQIEGGKIIDDLFHLDADGNFCLGSSFGYSGRSLTWGPFDKLTHHTFIGAGKAHLRGYVYWVNPLDGSTPTRWVNPRKWEDQLMYVQHDSRLELSWMRLQRVGDRWLMAAASNFPYFHRTQNILDEAYHSCEEYYAKWRRKYYRIQGLPDPETILDDSEVETVDYIEQHLNVYDPPKARLLHSVADTC